LGRVIGTIIFLDGPGPRTRQQPCDIRDITIRKEDNKEQKADFRRKLSLFSAFHSPSSSPILFLSTTTLTGASQWATGFTFEWDGDAGGTALSAPATWLAAASASAGQTTSTRRASPGRRRSTSKQAQPQLVDPRSHLRANLAWSPPYRRLFLLFCNVCFL
jgi:hypothetical protein